MFKTRLLSGIILVILAILFIYSGGVVLCGVLLTLSLIGTFELLRVFKLQNTWLAGISYTGCIAYYIFIYFDFPIIFFVTGLCVFYLIIYVFTYPRYSIDVITKSFFGFFYVPFMLGFIYLTRNLEFGQYIVWLVFLTSWGCDTFAYCAGKLFGKHKMAPVLSPKKSVEGAIGGLLGTVLLTYIFLYVFRSQMTLMPKETVIIALLSAVAGFISMIGDLAASAIKRNYDIKDYGRLIPGHGGVLDRFDSVIITSPIIYCLGILLNYFVI